MIPKNWMVWVVYKKHIRPHYHSPKTTHQMQGHTSTERIRESSEVHLHDFSTDKMLVNQDGIWFKKRYCVFGVRTSNGAWKTHKVFMQPVHQWVQKFYNPIPVSTYWLLQGHIRRSRPPSTASSSKFWCLYFISVIQQLNLVLNMNRLNVHMPSMTLLKKILAKKMLTWMQRLKRGDISFLRLSRIKPNIFSKEAVSCCLNNIAGYLAYICDMLFRCPKAFKGGLRACKKSLDMINNNFRYMGSNLSGK